MNDEYLWDKTGDDPGIRKLENALSEFRMQPGNAPVIRPAAAAVEPGRRGVFRLGFAFAAVAVIITVAAVAGLIGLRDQKMARIDPPPVQDAPLPDATTDIAKSDPTGPRTETMPVPRPRKLDRPRLVKTVYFKRQKPKSVREPGDRPLLDESQLTAEERQAYEKLMLALSITSSKLKIVKDKLNGGGE